MNLLTLNQLENMPTHHIFAHGIDPIGDSGELLYWVACSGSSGVGDWAIYSLPKDNLAQYPDIESFDRAIQAHGNKLYDKQIIAELVPCSVEALAMYRK